MLPTQCETTAQLIARRPERLNILVLAMVSGSRGWRRGRGQDGNPVLIRYGWSPLSRDELAGIDRPVGILVPILGTRFDHSELNMIGQPGAFVSMPDIPGIRRAVAELRAAWGDLHVQDNSGLVPDLHQGMWQG